MASPTEKHRRPTSSFLSSPRLFTGFTSIGFSDAEAAMSPTSILDTKPFSGFRNPFWSEPITPKTTEPHEHKRPWDKSDSKGILAIVDDALGDDKPKPESRMVLFGSQLKIQIPTLLVESTKSPNFGNSLKSPIGSEIEISPNSNKVFAGCLSVSEMELSEDYTCVITHGPNPKTTHIFDNCIIESCCGASGFSSPMKENGLLGFSSESFLSFCHTCKKRLGEGQDIYMYRGEKAFCSDECRCQEMLLEEEEEEKADRFDRDHGDFCSL